LVKHILIFGPPGAGKGTFSSQIIKVFPEINHISTGDIFRENLINQTPLGLKAKGYMDKGELVPDNLTNELIKDRLEKIISKSWLLDGYPRNLQQAEFLDEITKVDLFLLLEVSRDIITKRILGRYSCKSCGEIHNKYTLPPKKEGICNNCGEEIKFEQRSDDNEETLKNRLDAYEKNAEPIIKYYKKKKLLKKVNAENTLELTGEQIKAILKL
jgi:adenylate kinase